MRIRSLFAVSLSSALLLGASAAASAQDDPAQLLAQSLTATSSVTSFHFLVTADGSIDLGDSFGGKPLDISGAKAEGDVSVSPQAVQVSEFQVPLGPVSISGGLIYPGDGNVYVKLALPNASAVDVWHSIPVGDMVPNLMASPAPGDTDMATKIQDAITQSGATLTNDGDVPCAAGTCTKFHLEVPASSLDSTVGAMLPGESPAASAAAAAPIPVDILVDNATKFVDSVSAHAVDAAAGLDLTIAIQLSAFNQPVTITAPPADQVTTDPLF